MSHVGQYAVKGPSHSSASELPSQLPSSCTSQYYLDIKDDSYDSVLHTASWRFTCAPDKTDEYYKLLTDTSYHLPLCRFRTARLQQYDKRLVLCFAQPGDKNQLRIWLRAAGVKESMYWHLKDDEHPSDVSHHQEASPIDEYIAPECCLYCLPCADNRWYAGYAESLPHRLAKHYAGKGAMFTRNHPPIRGGPVQVYYGGRIDEEDCLVIDMMIKHGIDRVRGGRWCSEDLTPSERQEIESMMRVRRAKGTIIGGKR
jgi:hypothetical protein